MAFDLNIDLIVLNEFNKTELESKVEPISETAIRAVFEMAKYLETTMTYLFGMMDDRELSRHLTGTEIIGKAELVEYNPRDSRLRGIAAQIDSLPEPDRNSLLDQIENLMKFYHQTLLNRQKAEGSDA